MPSISSDASLSWATEQALAEEIPDLKVTLTAAIAMQSTVDDGAAIAVTLSSDTRIESGVSEEGGVVVTLRSEMLMAA